MHLTRNLTACGLFIAAISLAACGGGGGGGGTGGGGFTPPTATPTPTQTAQAYAHTQKLVSLESGLPLSGVQVSVGATTAGAVASPVTTTAPDGTFTITTLPGPIYMTIGSDKWPDPNNFATVHAIVTAGANTNPLTPPTIAPVQGFTAGSTPAPNATPNVVENSGNWRLATLTATEINCLANLNSLRGANHLSTTIIPDEWLQEQNRDYWNFITMTNSAPAYATFGYGAFAGNDNSNNCAKMSTAFQPGSQSFLQLPNLLWAAGDSGNVSVAPGSGPELAFEEMVDPRGVMPTPTPTSVWP